MSQSVREFSLWRSPAWLRREPAGVFRSPRWCLSELSGRLCELSGSVARASLTLAFGLVLDAQQQGETVAWVLASESVFFPPDVAESGVDLEALVVVRVPGASAAARAGDKLVRSGGFGLVVLDLDLSGGPMAVAGWRASSWRRNRGQVPAPLLARLVKLAQRHDTTVLCLTDKSHEDQSLSALVSLRCETRREAVGQELFNCELIILKDKRRGPRWSHEEICLGPVGLCPFSDSHVVLRSPLV